MAPYVSRIYVCWEGLPSRANLGINSMSNRSFKALVSVLLLGLILLPTANAQPKSKKKKKGPPKPVLQTLRTTDRVLIQSTYYAGTKGKQTVPIIMLHDFEGNRNDYHQLALFLQRNGHACLVPDLRGHGRSIRTQSGGTIELKRMRRKHFEAMVLDVEAAKGFFMKEHNSGKVNIELLTVVGAGMGTVVGLKWSVRDWNAVPLPAFKQGQDVKALILLSPRYNFKGVSTRVAMTHRAVAGKLFTAVIVGARDKTSKEWRDAKRMHTTFKKRHPKLKGEAKERPWAESVYLFKPDTALQGTRLIRPGLNLEGFLRGFLQQKVATLRPQFPWAIRRNPADDDE